MDAPDFLEGACAEFGRRLEAVGGRWHDATPCSDWDVRALVQHAVNECAWIPPLLEGKTIADVGSALDGDLLGDDPVAAWRRAAAGAVAAARAPGAMQATAHLSYGDRTGDQYVTQVAGDLVIHTWDLARAVGTEERIDPALVSATAGMLGGAPEEVEMARSYGLFAAVVEVPDDADAQTRMLAFTGRRA